MNALYNASLSEHGEKATVLGHYAAFSYSAGINARGYLNEPLKYRSKPRGGGIHPMLYAL